MKRIRIIASAVALMATLAAGAQNISNCWIVGTAVPDFAQKMERTPDGGFMYAGPLKAGEARITTSLQNDAAVQLLTPAEADASLVNKGIKYHLTTGQESPAWQVYFTEDLYRVFVNTQKGEVRGEIFRPWGELFIGGGATENGWDNKHMQPFTQSADDPCVWTWTGELRPHSQFKEPNAFKLEGQLKWGPKQLHPFTAQADVLETSQIRLGGNDDKWQLSRAGRYRLTVNVFKLTMKAEFLGE